MEDCMYCSFCGRVVRSEFQFCPFCGVQCRDLPGSGESDSCEEACASSSQTAIHRLEVLASALTDMESELDHFLSTRKP